MSAGMCQTCGKGHPTIKHAEIARAAERRAAPARVATRLADALGELLMAAHGLAVLHNDSEWSEAQAAQEAYDRARVRGDAALALYSAARL